MKQNQTTDAGRPPGSPSKRFFTLDEAQRALVFVRRVVQDIVHYYQELIKLRDELEGLADTPVPPEQIASLRDRNERLTDTLNRLHDELIEVGCQLKDWRMGLIDFPATHEGREVLLCWRLGEERIAHWHEVDAGFGGRRPIDASFGD